MIFKRKYVFETTHTKKFRVFLNALVVLSCLSVAYFLFAAYIILDASSEGKEAETHFVQTAPDLIVVFTGGPGRLKLAVEASKEFNQPNVFISGVYKNNSVQTLIDEVQSDIKDSSDFIELDYTARNTVENVVATLKYIRQNRGLNNILIISSDYHILRIKMILASLKQKGDQYNFYYSPVMNNYFRPTNIKILLTEVFKILRTQAFLIYWDQKSPIHDYLI